MEIHKKKINKRTKLTDLNFNLDKLELSLKLTSKWFLITKNKLITI